MRECGGAVGDDGVLQLQAESLTLTGGQRLELSTVDELLSGGDDDGRVVALLHLLRDFGQARLELLRERLDLGPDLVRGFALLLDLSFVLLDSGVQRLAVRFERGFQFDVHCFHLVSL